MGTLLNILLAFLRRLAKRSHYIGLFVSLCPKLYPEQPAEGDGDGGEGGRRYPDPPWVLQQSNQAVSTRDSYPHLHYK